MLTESKQQTYQYIDISVYHVSPSGQYICLIMITILAWKQQQSTSDER